jgi:hypothetical protein
MKILNFTFKSQASYANEENNSDLLENNVTKLPKYRK